MVFLTGMFLYFAGIEVSGVHALEVKDPQKDYPKAILIAAVIVTAIFLFGSLSVATIVPANQISLTAGVMQTFMAVFDKFNLGWLLPILVVLTAPGMIVQVSSWIARPKQRTYGDGKKWRPSSNFSKNEQKSHAGKHHDFSGNCCLYSCLHFLIHAFSE